jgi:hypothetical protein
MKYPDHLDPPPRPDALDAGGVDAELVDWYCRSRLWRCHPFLTGHEVSTSDTAAIGPTLRERGLAVGATDLAHANAPHLIKPNEMLIGW